MTMIMWYIPDRNDQEDAVLLDLRRRDKMSRGHLRDSRQSDSDNL